MGQQAPVETLIIGGGHAGLLLGAALAHAGIEVRLIERQPREAIIAAAPDGRALALLAGSVEIVRRVGAWARVAPTTEPIQRVEVADVDGGGRVHYDSSVHGTGPFGVGVEQTQLRKALLEALVDHAGSHAILRDEIVELQCARDSITATFASGATIAAPLVVGADGRGSRVRELGRIAVDRWAYDQRALAMVLRHERAHDGIVREWLRRGGPLAILPLPGRRSGITWVERAAEAEALATMSPDELLAAFGTATGCMLGRAEIESGPSCFPLGAQHARRYVAPRLALVGDAAHGVHPIHAQGFNMGVADVGALVDALVAAKARGLDLGSGEALLPYARARRSDNTQRLWLTDGLVRLFTADVAPLRAARSLALDTIERLPPLKRLAVRHGMRAG